MANKNQIITIGETDISIRQINHTEYISLTDISNWDNDSNSKTRIRNWLKNRETIEFLALWERSHNPDFNYAHMDVIRKDFSRNAYIISPKKWIEETGAIGIRSQAGRYSGTYTFTLVLDDPEDVKRL